jgi:BirA family biotin operon repressor/biotin-[acetyl-CoA-carboxylase] ligase
MDIKRILQETFVVEVERHAELGSTNDRAMDRAKQGAKRLPLLVIADRQTAGRGRGGNRWWSGSGSLTFSLLLESTALDSKSADLLGRQLNCRPNIGAVPLISITSGMAVVETLKPLLGKHLLGLHWPNDIIADGKKLAGILVEVLPDGRTVIGIGINTNNSMAEAPTVLRSMATSMLDLTGIRYDHTELLVALFQHMQKHLVALKDAPSQLSAQADALCLQRGKQLTIQLGRQTIVGLCRGIAPDGALLLETSEGLRSCYSGTINR